MKNPVLIIAAIVILGIFGIGVFTLSQKPSPESDSTIDTDHPTTASGKGMMMFDQTRYVEYSKTAFDNVADKRRVLYFYANWCPICRPADLNFKENASKIPEDVVVVRVNYNDSDTDQEEKDLAQKYGITYQHTFVQIDKQGNKITAWNGGQIDELLNSKSLSLNLGSCLALNFRILYI